MEIEDLRNLEDGREIATDLCIIGSGPAGLTIASEFISRNIRVLIVESGGLEEDPDVDALSRIESIGAPRQMEPRLVRNRIFGGTSHSWTGRCAPFDDVDFAARPWVPFSGWPVTRESLEPYLERAGPYIGLGRNCYDERLWDLIGRPRPTQDIDSRQARYCFWQFSTGAASSLDFMRFGPAFMTRNAANTRILLHATATEIETDPTGRRVVGVRVGSITGKRATIRPKVVVLCAGGIENARVMLYSSRFAAAGIGNANDLVGRFLMDHPRCSLGEFDTSRAGELRDRYGLFQLKERGRSRFFAPGISLSPDFQRRMQLLNCAAWLTEDRAPDDPWDAAKRLLSGRERRIVPDLWSIVSQPQIVVRGLCDRMLRGRGLPHKLRHLVLDCIVEQRPDPESRLSLSEERDRLGLPVARLDWRISEQEKATAAALGTLIRDEFTRIGLVAPVLADWIRQGDFTGARFADVSHPAGTTRMARDPKFGVVDETCRVHGVSGLYVAGSSIFPTTGHANPTLTIVAFAIRLADHLREVEFAGGASKSGARRPSDVMPGTV